MASLFHTRRQFIASGLFVAVGLTAGCISITEDTSPFDELTEYHNEEFSYTVLRPDSWAIEESTPRHIQFTTDPFDGQMTSTAHEAVPEADAELTAAVWNGYRSRYLHYESVDKQLIELPSGHTGVVLDIRYNNGQHNMHEKTIFVVDQYTHVVTIEHITDAYPGKFDAMARAIVDSVTIG